MKMIIHPLQAYMQHVHQKQAKEFPSTSQPEAPRSGWPELSDTPLVRRRSTDAMRWYPHGPPDDWKR